MQQATDPIPQRQQGFVPTFANCVRRAERKLRSTLSTRIFYEPVAFSPDTLLNMPMLIEASGRLARAHIFFYIVWGVHLLRQMAAEIPFAFPQLENHCCTIIERCVAETPWDHRAVQSMLFDCPLDYSYEQAWRLSAAVFRSYLLSPRLRLARRRLAFAMATAPRLGERSHAAVLDEGLVRLVLELVVEEEERE